MILGIETSTAKASLALLAPGRGEVVWETDFTTDRAHNSAIFGPLGAMLDRHRSDLRGIVVGLGPGSYSGIRVGIAVANGLGLALGIPAIGVSSLEAWEAASDDYVVLGDARRRSLFVAEIAGGKPIGEPRLVDDGEVAAALEPLRERGLALHSADRRVIEHVAGVVLSFPSATRLALAAPDPADERWRKGEALEPRYLRSPYITTPRKKDAG
ncbi:MAG: tRNA (adenosine(37)-N6)-threonylcarbamoyltransferase complex dimerization subunit type 1 TsaB [Verrucomicrobiales bacterium]